MKLLNNQSSNSTNKILKIINDMKTLRLKYRLEPTEGNLYEFEILEMDESFRNTGNTFSTKGGLVPVKHTQQYTTWVPKTLIYVSEEI